MNYSQKERFIDNICGVGLMLIFIEVLYGIVESSYNINFSYDSVNNGIYICGGVILAIAIAVLVYAYLKKDSVKKCYGFELLVMAFTVVLLPGCYIYFPTPFSWLKTIFPIMFIVYYIGKTVYVVKHRNDVITNNKKR